MQLTLLAETVEDLVPTIFADRTRDVEGIQSASLLTRIWGSLPNVRLAGRVSRTVGTKQMCFEATRLLPVNLQLDCESLDCT